MYLHSKLLRAILLSSMIIMIGCGSATSVSSPSNDNDQQQDQQQNDQQNDDDQVDNDDIIVSQNINAPSWLVGEWNGTGITWTIGDHSLAYESNGLSQDLSSIEWEETETVSYYQVVYDPTTYRFTKTGNDNQVEFMVSVYGSSSITTLTKQ